MKANKTSNLNQPTKVTLVGAIADLILGVAKISLGIIDNSQALVADGIHSISDLLTDAIVLFAIRESRKAADKEHPYGHARIETIATVLLAFLLFIVSLSIANDALNSMQETGETVTPGWVALGVVVISALCKEAIYHYTMRVAKSHRSAILEANAWHSRTDAISSLIVFIGISGAMLGLPALDSVAAIGVAGIIAKVAWDLGIPSVLELVDTGVDQPYLQRLKDSIRTTQGVRSFHKLRTRRMGANVLLDVRVNVDPMITVSEGHQIAEQVRCTIVNHFHEINDVTVHIDAEPETQDDRNFTTNLPSREALAEALHNSWQDYEPARMVRRTNLHYLREGITLEVYLPLDLAISPFVAGQISDEIRGLALNAVPQINEVQVLFLQ